MLRSLELCQLVSKVELLKLEVIMFIPASLYDVITHDRYINMLIVLLRQVRGCAFILKCFFCRLAAMLRQLAQFHAKDPNNLFMVRIAQGLTHLGKGTLTLCPYHSDRQLLSPVALAGLLSTLIGFLDVKNSK